MTFDVNQFLEKLNDGHYSPLIVGALLVLFLLRFIWKD